jgi:hypothetical protein
MDRWAALVQHHVAFWTDRCASRGVKWLPQFAYHFTNVANAVSILESGVLLSRNEATRRGLMKTDNASASIIASTQAAHLGFVRLYFRPLTPTQYRNEGIRQAGALWQGAHCPMPIFFLFNLARVLWRTGVEVSDGNMGSPNVVHGRTPDLLSSIPFDLVYHDGWFQRGDRKITYHRQAEILVPTQLDLSDLVAIACRSDGERQTLLHLLQGTVWEKRTCVAPELFYKKWSYVETGHSEQGLLVLRLHRGEESSASPTTTSIRVEERDTGRYWLDNTPQAESEYRVTLLDPPGRSLVTVKIEGCLAYQNTLDFTDDIPF